MSLGTKVSLGVSSTLIFILVLSAFGFVSYQTSFFEKKLLQRADDTVSIMEAVHTQAMLHRRDKSDHDPVILALDKSFHQLSRAGSHMALWLVMGPKVMAYQISHHRKEREPPRDAVDNETLASGQTTYRMTGDRVFRLSRPVVLGQGNAAHEKCAVCHGTDMGIHPGEVIGAYSIALSIAAERENLEETKRIAILISVVASLIIAGVCFFMIRRLATQPIAEMTRKMGQLAAGDLSLEIPYERRPDEIGDMARSVQVFKENAIEKQRVEAQARQHQFELAQVLRRGTMGEMASALVHELAQPLATIATYSGTLVTKLRSGTGATQEAVDVLEKINDTAHRASQISKTIARHVRGAEPQKALIDINALLRSIAPLIDADARENGAQFILEADDAGAQVFGNPTEIESVVLNLARNSIEAMKEENRNDRVLCIAASIEDRDVVVAVTDTGRGISREKADRLFEPFFTTKNDGMGMGLTICRTIIENHGGRILIDTDHEQQTTIRFTLPCSNGTEKND